MANLHSGIAHDMGGNLVKVRLEISDASTLYELSKKIGIFESSDTNIILNSSPTFHFRKLKQHTLLSSCLLHEEPSEVSKNGTK